jgi:broad specificity phosphatase PhoE
VATLFLIRHGETDWNHEGRWQGHEDRGLTELGAAQARRAAEALHGVTFQAVYASDLRRATESARPLADAAGLAVEELRDLREIDTGSWTGLTRDEVAAVDPAGAARHASGGAGWSGGETYEELQQRTAAALTRIAAARPDDRVAVFTHGGVIRAAVAQALGAPAEAARTRLSPLAHVSLTVLEIDDHWRLNAFNVALTPAGTSPDIN